MRPRRKLGKMRTALYGIDIVDVRINILVEVGVIGHCHLDRDTATLRVEGV